MNSFTLLQISLVAPVTILALECLVICAAVLLRRRPLVVDGRVPALILAVSIAILSAGLVALVISVTDLAAICFAAFSIVLLVTATAAVFRTLRGVFVFGVSGDTLRLALREAFSELGMVSNETLNGFEFPDQPEKLRVMLTRRLGTAQLQVEGAESSALLRITAGQVKLYFARNAGDFSLSSALIYGACGVFGLFVALYQWSRS